MGTGGEADSLLGVLAAGGAGAHAGLGRVDIDLAEVDVHLDISDN